MLSGAVRLLSTTVRLLSTTVRLLSTTVRLLSTTVRLLSGPGAAPPSSSGSRSTRRRALRARTGIAAAPVGNVLRPPWRPVPGVRHHRQGPRRAHPAREPDHPLTERR